MTTSDVRPSEPGDVPSERAALPPGQFRLDGFPRFGTHLHRAPPAVPDPPVLEIAGDVSASTDIGPSSTSGTRSATT